MDVTKQIREDSGILALPQSLSEILREMEDPNFSTEDIAGIILRDPALTAKILKLVNSSFYHQVSQVNTVHQAIQVLGAVTVKCMALSTTILNPEKFENQSGLNIREFFTKVLMTAAASEKIAHECKMKSPEEALIAGLLHEIGTLFFVHQYPQEYAEIARKKLSSQDLIDAESKIFGINHAQAGYELAVKWRLPKDVCDAIADHLSPSVSPDKCTLCEVIRLACLLAEDDSEGCGEAVNENHERIKAAATALGLSDEQIEMINASMPGWSIEIADHMGVDIGSLDEMVVKANQKLWRSYLSINTLFKERQQLTEKILQQEREQASIKTKNIAIATLSHYLNNAMMAAYGRSQIVRQQLEKGEVEATINRLPETLDIIDNAVKKIAAVVAELKELSPLDDETKFLNTSFAIDIDDRIEQRLKESQKLEEQFIDASSS